MQQRAPAGGAACSHRSPEELSAGQLGTAVGGSVCIPLWLCRAPAAQDSVAKTHLDKDVHVSSKSGSANMPLQRVNQNFPKDTARLSLGPKKAHLF